MDGVKALAEGMAEYLGKNLQLERNDIALLRYGFEFYLITVINYVVILGLAWMLGITPYVGVALATNSSLRFISGGAHSATALCCLIIGTVIMVGIGQAAYLAGAVPEPLLFVFVAMAATIGIFGIYKWAPADTPAKPVSSPAKRAKFRKMSYIFIAAWAGIMTILIIWGTAFFQKLVLASLGGFGWQIFSITPAGYRFVAFLDIVFDKCCAVVETRKRPF